VQNGKWGRIYLIDMKIGSVPKVANNCPTINDRFGAIAASEK
jgi:hypothetical protein